MFAIFDQWWCWLFGPCEMIIGTALWLAALPFIGIYAAMTSRKKGGE